MHSITSHRFKSGLHLFVYVVSEHLRHVLSVALCVCVCDVAGHGRPGLGARV